MSYNKETGLYEGYIYLITNTINNKQYIGQTRCTVRQRWSGHVHPSGGAKTVIDKAINKYGKESFLLETILKIETKIKEDLILKLNKEEKRLIVEYDSLAPNGYNIDKGGNTHQYVCTPVDVYDMDGNIITTYQSRYLAAQVLNINVRTIERICNGKCPNYKRKYVFRNCNEPFDLYDINSSFMKKTYAYNLDGTLYKEFQTRHEAVVDTGCTFIANIIDDPYRVGMGYWWSSVQKYNYKGVEKKKIYKVDLYSIDGDKLKEFNSVSECAKYIGSSSSRVSKVCKGNGMTVKGYIVRYHGQPFELKKSVR